MNIIQKWKYKRIIEGCDYQLAAEVLYDKFVKNGDKSGTISSFLLDKYFENPDKDNALLLIDHNEMMVFYFNECKPGGLYTRQHKGKSKVHADKEPDLQPSEVLQAEPPVRNVKTKSKSGGLQQLPEEDFIPSRTSGARKPIGQPQMTRNDAAAPAPQTHAGKSASATAEMHISRMEVAAALTKSAPESESKPKPQAAAKPVEAAVPAPAESTPDVPTPAASTPAAPTPAPPAPEPAIQEAPPVKPVPEAQKPKPKPPSPYRNVNFGNVIATLQIDCEELALHIRKLRRQISERVDVERNRAALVKYEEAYYEFSTAIKLLREQMAADQDEA